MPTPMTLAEIKGLLRAGQYAWPGGYPLYFITSDGAALSFGTVRAEWRNVVQAHLWNDKRSGWHLAGCDANWEDPELYWDLCLRACGALLCQRSS